MITIDYSHKLAKIARRFSSTSRAGALACQAFIATALERRRISLGGWEFLPPELE